MNMPAHEDRERLQIEAEKYAAYLETPEGRLRLDLPFANLQEFLPKSEPGITQCALDLGCGTGANGLRLARLGFQVTLMDASEPMLDIAKRDARKAGVLEKTEIKQGDLETNHFPERTFDVIVCHNVLEFVDDPSTVLRNASLALRNSSAVLSLLVRNRAGEVLKAGILAGDLAAAEHNLATQWGSENLCGGKVRLFDPENTRTMLESGSLTVIAERGVRVMSDYLPSRISLGAEYETIFELERKLGMRTDFSAVARYTHYLARRSDRVSEDFA